MIHRGNIPGAHGSPLLVDEFPESSASAAMRYGVPATLVPTRISAYPSGSSFHARSLAFERIVADPSVGVHGAGWLNRLVTKSIKLFADASETRFMRIAWRLQARAEEI